MLTAGGEAREEVYDMLGTCAALLKGGGRWEGLLKSIMSRRLQLESSKAFPHSDELSQNRTHYTHQSREQPTSHFIP